MRTPFTLTAVFIVLGFSAAWSTRSEYGERPSVCATRSTWPMSAKSAPMLKVLATNNKNAITRITRLG